MTDDAPGRPGERRRPTKAERKEQARREREELERRMASKRRARTVGIVAGAVVIAAVVFGATLLPSSGGDFPEPATLLQQAANAATQAECGEVLRRPTSTPRSTTASHIDHAAGSNPCPLPDHPAGVRTPRRRPPTLPAGVYDSLTLERALPGDPLARARCDDRLVRPGGARRPGRAGHRVLRPSPAGRAGRPGPSDRCARTTSRTTLRGSFRKGPDGAGRLASSPHVREDVDLAVAFDFTSQYSSPTAENREYVGVAPEPGGSL